MNEIRNRFLAFSFGDYEGVRAYLDALAAQGWELTGRSGWLSGRFESTNRTELCYDVVPVLPRKPEELQREVERRREAGWEPVETIWGMDIYKSMPCRQPQPMRDEAAIRTVFANWLVRAGMLIAVTAAALFMQRGGVNLIDLLGRWYLSDSKTACVFLLPAVAVIALLFLTWMGLCLAGRCGPHQPSGRMALALRGGVQLAGICCVALLMAASLLGVVPRLWIRLALLGGILLVLPVAHMVGGDDRRKRIIAAGISGTVLLGLLVFAWTVKPVEYELSTSGGRAPVLSAQCLETAPVASACQGWYEQEESLLVRQICVSQQWESGERIDVWVCQCRLEPLAELVYTDMAGDDTADADWQHFWVRDGSQIYSIAGNVDVDVQSVIKQMEELLRG